MTPEQHQIDQLLEYLVDQIAINKNYWKNNDFLEGLYDQLIHAVGPSDCGETYKAGKALAQELEVGKELCPISSRFCSPKELREILSIFETGT